MTSDILADQDESSDAGQEGPDTERSETVAEGGTQSVPVPDCLPGSDPVAELGDGATEEPDPEAPSANVPDLNSLDSPTSEPTSTLAAQNDNSSLSAAQQMTEEDRHALTEMLQTNIELFRTLGEQLTEDDINCLRDLGNSLPELIPQLSKSKTGGLESELLAFGRLIKAVTLSEQRDNQIEEIITSAQNLSHKKTNELVTVRKLLRQLKSEIGWPLDAPKSDSFEKLLATELKLDEMAIMNQQFQEQLLESTKELVDSLGKALETGSSTEASALWDKIQGNIKNLSGRAQHDFKLQTTEFRNQVNELRGWKKFAATEKKKELIETVRQLSEATATPPEVAREINNLHKEWKKLGYSNQNEKLWREFKTLSDQAYAPCKEYFKKQKSVLAENFKQRTKLCKRLEEFLENLESDNIKIIDLKKTETQAKDEWKRYAPVEQSKVKALQKRFYESLNGIRNIRRDAARKNGELKEELVKQAQGLLELEDRREAMNQAQKLQADWKAIGPSFAKDDRIHWDKFRAACDALFKERDEARKALKSDIDNSLKSLKDILLKLEQMLEQDDDAFRESGKLFSSLRRDFNQSLSPNIKKERQQLQKRFDTLTRKIEARFTKLPDKKQLRALHALQARAKMCQDLEKQLQACIDEDELRNTLTDVDQDGWKQLPPSGNPDLDKAMEQRWKALFTIKTPGKLMNLIEEMDQTARRRVVEAEISSHVDSPDHDKALRMELQLQQLTSNFGKASTENSGARERAAWGLQLQYLCTGPLSEQIRSDLDPRVTRILEKVL